MNYNSTVKNFIMFLLSLVVLGCLVYGFLIGDRKAILINIAIISVLIAMYQIAKYILIIKCSNNQQSISGAKYGLIQVLIGAFLLIILIPIMFIYFV